MPVSLFLAVLTIAFCCFRGFAYGQTAAAPTLKPLDKVLAELRSEKDLAKASYYFKRCAGYSFATSKLLGSSGGDRLKERSDEWRKEGMSLIEYAADTEMAIQKIQSSNSKKSKDDWFKETVDIALEFANIYIGRMNANYLQSGSYVFDDPWLKSEHELCIAAPNKVLGALK